MEFQEMCEKLFDNEYRMAYRKAWPELLSTVRIANGSDGTPMLVYYMLNSAEMPVPITKDTFDVSDWECCNEFSERLSIKNFMTMPGVKEFLQKVKEHVANQDDPAKYQSVDKVFSDYTMKGRMAEAMTLRLMFVNREQKLVLTDIGWDLVNTL